MDGEADPARGAKSDPIAEAIETLRRRGRPIGVARLAARIGASCQGIRQIVEPFLLRRGLITFTSRGRALAEPLAG